MAFACERCSLAGDKLSCNGWHPPHLVVTAMTKIDDCLSEIRTGDRLFMELSNQLDGHGVPVVVNE